jgi:nucleotide-binding universal stress UspA family protein
VAKDPTGVPFDPGATGTGATTVELRTVVRKETAMNRRPAPILVATDASEDAHDAVRVAASVAARSGSPLHIVHVWQMPFAFGIVPMAIDPGLADDAGEAILDAECVVAERSGARVSGTHLRRGMPAAAILGVADALRAGMIVVGRRGLGAVGRVVLGSVSDGVVQHAGVPVLVVHGSNWPPSRLVVGDEGSDEAGRAAVEAFHLAALVDVPCEEVQSQALDAAGHDATALVVVGRTPRHHGVAEHVLHHAAGSVLVVPVPAAAPLRTDQARLRVLAGATGSMSSSDR